MRKAIYDTLKLKLDQLDYAVGFVESNVTRDKLNAAIKDLRTAVQEAYIDNPTNRNVSKSLRMNFVKANPGLLDAATKIVNEPLNSAFNISDLCDEKYFRIVMTFVKDKIPDIRYYTFSTGEERMMVKIAGTPVETEEHYEPTF